MSTTTCDGHVASVMHTRYRTPACIHMGYHVVIVHRTCHEYALWRWLWAVRLHIAVTVKKVLTVSRLHSDVNPTPQRTVWRVRGEVCGSGLNTHPRPGDSPHGHLHKGLGIPTLLIHVVLWLLGGTLNYPLHMRRRPGQHATKRLSYTVSCLALSSYTFQCIQDSIRRPHSRPCVYGPRYTRFV